MRIENKKIEIKIGNKRKSFTNMILNNYLDLFADSIIEFKDKELRYCLVNFTKNNINIDESSTEMEYDTVLEANNYKIMEICTENSIINKYYYTETPYGEKDIKSFKGKNIKDLGFARYDYELKKYIIYAYINVSNYNIVIQENQPIVISRIDKISSDMNLWSNNKEIKAPIHLTINGIREYIQMDYSSIIPKFHSVGFGVVPYKLEKEYLVDDLNVSKIGIGEIKINDNLEAEYHSDTLLFSNELKLGEQTFLKKPTYPLLIYKFKLYKETYPNPEEPPVWKDTGNWYTQYKRINKNGKINLFIKYERR